MSRGSQRSMKIIPLSPPFSKGGEGGFERLFSSDTALIRLMQLVSPVLPIGAYAYSQGLEYAVSSGWVRDEKSAFERISGISGAGLSMLDLPVLIRLYGGL